MNTKYEITDIAHEKYPFLHRIRALRDIGSEVSQPEKPRKRSLKELAELDKAGDDLTPEEAERLAAHRQKAQSMAQQAESHAASEATATDVERTCRMFRSGLAPHPGRNGTTGSPSQSEKDGLAGFESPRRNRPGSGGRVGEEAGI